MNITDLQDALDAETAWRKKELAQAKALADSATSHEAEKYLCRAWILMMYAHCDNFTKQSSTAYLEYIKLNSRKSYNKRLMWLVMKAGKIITEAKDENYQSLQSYKKQRPSDLLGKQVLNSIFHERSFQYKTLRFYCDWALQIDYDYSLFKSFCENLKRKRDKIAHGEEAYVDRVIDCEKFHQETIELIDSLKEKMIESLL